MKRLLLFLILAPCWARAQVAFNTSGTGVYQSGTSFSQAYTIPSGSNQVTLAVVGWGHATGETISAITLGGSAMTSCGAAISTSDGGWVTYTQCFYLINPATGSKTLAITATSGTTGIMANVRTFTSVNQTTPIRPNTYATQTSDVFSGLTSILVPSQAGDLVVSQQINDNQLITGNLVSDTSIGTASLAYMTAGHASATAPQLLTVFYNGNTTFHVGMLSFSLQSTNNTTVMKTINGVTVGPFLGNIKTRNGVKISSILSGGIKTINGLATPSGTSLINIFLNPSLGGTSGVTPTTTTLGNSLTGDFGYTSESVAELTAGMTYSNAGSPPSTLPIAVSDNSGATNASTGSLGFLCTTGASTHCGEFQIDDTNLGPSASMGYWFYSTCTGATQDCGAGAGLESSGNGDGLSLHVNGVTPCAYSGFSIDPGGTSSCLAGAYTPSTWYRVNLQMNEGEPTFTATFSTITPSITATQTLAVNQAVAVSNSGGALPTGLSANTAYYVLSTGLSGSAFELSLTQGGTPIQVSTAGSGTNTFRVIHQMTICSATNVFIGTLFISASTSRDIPGQFSYGFGGEEPQTTFSTYWYGGPVDGTGKFSNTGCIL
jgi:hypothetical protein